jgi:splicing factor U2AF subunit
MASAHGGAAGAALLAGGPLGALGAVGLPALGGLGQLLPGSAMGLVPTPQTAQQAAQINRQARRLYVGNIPPGVSDQDLVEFFNEAMIKASVVQPDHRPVVSSQLNPDKSFSFIEFSTIDEATSGMALDGITMNGISLKVRRPKDYVSPPTALAPPSGIHIPGIVSTNVPDSPNKIFIGGLPAYLNEAQVKELLTAFGPLKAFNLVKDAATGNSKGYAFFEYLDASVTDRACQGLNGMKLGDKTLLVQRANIGAKQDGTGGIMMPMSPGALNPSPSAASLLNLQVPAATLLSGMLLGQPQAETRVLQLLNLVRPEELVSDEDHADIMEDVRQECEKYGNVLSVTIPRPALTDDGKLDPTQAVDGLGRVFVEFADQEDASRAQSNLAGRKFGGHVVLTSYLDEDDYDQRDFSRH